jgi:hypothetical protein
MTPWFLGSSIFQNILAILPILLPMLDQSIVSLPLTQFQTPLSLFSFSAPFSFSLAYVDYGSLSVFTVSPLYNSLILDLLCDSDLFWVFPAIQQVSIYLKNVGCNHGNTTGQWLCTTQMRCYWGLWGGSNGPRPKIKGSSRPRTFEKVSVEVQVRF